MITVHTLDGKKKKYNKYKGDWRLIETAMTSDVQKWILYETTRPLLWKIIPLHTRLYYGDEYKTLRDMPLKQFKYNLKKAIKEL
jgi:hypothetical protein